MSFSSHGRGLDEFLKHLKRRPYQDTLMQRYCFLVFELPDSDRRFAMEKLLDVVGHVNAQGALRACYWYLQGLRNLSAPLDEEIAALDMARRCYQKLGKNNYIQIVGDEIARLEKRRDQERLKPKVPVPADARSRRTMVGDAFSSAEYQESYEQLAVRLFAVFKLSLRNFAEIRHPRLAVATLVRAYQLVYKDHSDAIRRALHMYGRNPLLWTADGDIQRDMTSYFSSCRIFKLGEDHLTETRIRMLLEILTAHFDQALLLPLGKSAEGDRNLRMEILEDILISIFDFSKLEPEMGA